LKLKSQRQEITAVNKKVSVALLVFLTPVVMLSHVSWSQADNGLLLNVDGRDVDLVGILKDKWRASTKMCRAVSELNSTDPQFKTIQSIVQAYSPPDSVAMRTMYAWRSGSWALAEVEFERLLPAVVPIKNIDTNPEVVGDAIWSGMTLPWKSGPFIRAYLASKSNDMPDALLECFELQTVSFK
jgi:hypothetical protein